jgi:hypothetical protein
MALRWAFGHFMSDAEKGLIVALEKEDAKKEESVVSLKKGKREKVKKEYERVPLEFSGAQWEGGDEWAPFKNSASINYTHLKDFYSQKNLKKTLKHMEPGVSRDNLQKVFEEFIWIFGTFAMSHGRYLPAHSKRIKGK